MAYQLSTLLKFFTDYAPLLTNLLILIGFFLLLSKSIKKHANIYYVIFGIPLALLIIDIILPLIGVTSFSVYKIPVLGDVVWPNTNMINLGYPILIIIMYIGALNPKNPYVRKLLVIRKEMSIISGFSVLAHSWVRVSYTFPSALGYFTDHSGYIEKNEWVKSDLGVGLSNFGYVLGILMVVLFLVLWVTSFDSIHKKMGGRKWKAVQKWSYVLYAMLFIHSITLHAGWLINSNLDDKVYLIKEGIAISSTTLIFLSYLILRVRKAKNKVKNIPKHTTMHQIKQDS